MGIKANKRNRQVFNAFVKEAVEKSEQLIIRNLQAVGEYAIGFARDGGLYTDQTGSLRSSVG